jgi:phenylalanyl-tRNA synthetase beta subunit
MVDEIGRIYGYEKIEPVLPSFDFPQTDNEIYSKIQNVRSVLIAQGYKEVMTYVFADTGEVKVLNSASNKTALRANLKDGVKKAYDLNKQNMAVLGLDEIKIFEIGSVFMKDVEEVRVCFNLKKEIKEMKLEDFSISLLPEKEIFNPQVKIPTTENSFFVYKENKKQFKMWSVYPFITRDIAFWANEESYKKFQICAADFAKKYCSVAPRMFDTFTKEGKTSYAYRFVFQSFEKTLTDIEVDIQWKEFALEISKIPNIEIR